MSKIRTLCAISALAGGLLLNGCGNSNAQPTKPSSTKSTATADVQPVNNEHSHIAKALQDNLNKTGIDATVVSVTPIDMPDMYLANIANMPPVFTDKTGTYIMQGDLIALTNGQAVNLRQKAFSVIAKDMLMAINPNEMISFKPNGTPKASLYVFSDPTCHYCQLLHKDIKKINDLGITINYLAWPRSEHAIPLTESIWCSSNRQKALTDAKLGKMPKTASCDNPVQKHITLGLSLGVSGTPAIFTESGEQIGGYLPPDELAQLAITGKHQP